MSTNGDYFTEYFISAQLEALTERESRVIELRYGLTGDNPRKLEEIGQEIGVSRERVRQILKKSHRKILLRAFRHFKSGKTNQPCAELLLYLRSVIRPQEDNAIDRFVTFIEENLAHLPLNNHLVELVASLTYPVSMSPQLQVEEARRLIWQRPLCHNV